MRRVSTHAKRQNRVSSTPQFGILDVSTVVAVDDLAARGRHDINGPFTGVIAAVDEERHSMKLCRHDEDRVSSFRTE